MDKGLTDEQEPYDELPECIRQYYSRNEYLWLTDDQKRKALNAVWAGACSSRAW